MSDAIDIQSASFDAKSLTKQRLISLLSSYQIQLPPSTSKKEIYIALVEQHLPTWRSQATTAKLPLSSKKRIPLMSPGGTSVLKRDETPKKRKNRKEASPTHLSDENPFQQESSKMEVALESEEESPLKRQKKSKTLKEEKNMKISSNSKSSEVNEESNKKVNEESNKKVNVEFNSQSNSKASPTRKASPIKIKEIQQSSPFPSLFNQPNMPMTFTPKKSALASHLQQPPVASPRLKANSVTFADPPITGTLQLPPMMKRQRLVLLESKQETNVTRPSSFPIISVILLFFFTLVLSVKMFPPPVCVPGIVPPLIPGTAFSLPFLNGTFCTLPCSNLPPSCPVGMRVPHLIDHLRDWQCGWSTPCQIDLNIQKRVQKWQLEIKTLLEERLGRVVCQGEDLNKAWMNESELRRPLEEKAVTPALQSALNVALKEWKMDNEIMFETRLDPTNQMPSFKALQPRFNLSCQIHLFLYHYSLVLVAFFFFILFMLFLYYRQKKQRRIQYHVEQLTLLVLETLVQQEQLHYQQPQYHAAAIPVIQLRDGLLGTVAEKGIRAAVWQGVQQRLQRDSNVRESVATVKGDVHRVWEWVGSSLLSPMKKKSQ